MSVEGVAPSLIIFGAASAMAVLVDLEIYWLQYIILHCVSGSRRALRATCLSVALAGNALSRRFTGEDPNVYERLLFWSPWVGHLCIRRSGSLHCSHYQEVKLQLRHHVHNADYHRYYLHGLSSQSIMYKVYRRGKWVPEVEAWRL